MEAFQDVFFEQLVEIRKTPADWLKIIGIWLLAIIVSVACFLFLGRLGMFVFLLIFGAFWGAFKLSQRFSIEYEYSVTNGTMDVAKIIARSSRKFQLSLDLEKTQRLEKYKPGMEEHGDFKKIVCACNKNDPDAYFLVVSEDAKGTRALIFTPNDRLKKAIAKGLPKFLALTAFKD